MSTIEEFVRQGKPFDEYIEHRLETASDTAHASVIRLLEPYYREIYRNLERKAYPEVFRSSDLNT